MAPGNDRLGFERPLATEELRDQFEDALEKPLAITLSRFNLLPKNGDTSPVSTNGGSPQVSTNGGAPQVSKKGDAPPISTNGGALRDLEPAGRNGDLHPASIGLTLGRPAEIHHHFFEDTQKPVLLEDTQKSFLREQREKARDLRAEREERLLKNLTASEHQAVETTLEILRRTESTWLVYLFKYASSKRSKELAEFYQDRERSFEPQGRAWSEIWNEPKKVYITINKYVPEILKKWLNIFLPKATKV
jgi:hypothetical protein